MLIDHGADVSARDNRNHTPSDWAAENGNKFIHFCARMDVIRFLFHLGHLDVAKVLIDHGADVNTKAENNWTPLHQAARFGNRFFGFLTKWI